MGNDKKARAVSIAVCVPIHNGGDHLRDCLQSIAQQTLLPEEIILVDNASRDSSLDHCHDFKRTYPDLNINIHHFDELAEMGANWNRATKLATSEYLKLLPCDDLLEPRCLEFQIRPFLQEEGIALVVSGKKLINQQGKLLFTLRPLQAGRHTRSSIRRAALNSPSNKLGEPGAGLFRRSDLLRLQGFRPDFKYFVDVEFWYRLLSEGDLWVVDPPLYAFRIHPGGASARSRKNAIREFILLNALHGNPAPTKRFYLKAKAWFYACFRSVLIKAIG